MQFSQFLTPDCVLPALKAGNKKQILQELAAHAARKTGLDARLILENLLRRESLGSTALGQGIAIPHAKLDGLTQVTGVFARLANPVDFEAVDDQRVDLVFLLLAPETAGADHLKALARISRAFRDQALTAKLRGTDNAAGLYAILSESGTASHAA